MRTARTPLAVAIAALAAQTEIDVNGTYATPRQGLPNREKSSMTLLNLPALTIAGTPRSRCTPLRLCSHWAMGLLAGMLLQSPGVSAAGDYSDGSTRDDRYRITAEIGAKSTVERGTENARDAGPVTLMVPAGAYQATVRPTAVTVDLSNQARGVDNLLQLYSEDVGFADPWSAGILAASMGWNGKTYTDKPQPFPDAFYSGGKGGDVNLTVDASTRTLLLDLSPLPNTMDNPCSSPHECDVTVVGVMALSQGGMNGLWVRGGNPDYYSNAGSGGHVTVNYNGAGIETQGGGYATTTGVDVVGQVVGIMAISRGGVFHCEDNDCADKNNYEPSAGVTQTPGRGGDVTVSVKANSDPAFSEILLQQGSAVGVMAVSANGAIIADQDDAGFNVDASAVQAGIVNVTIGEDANPNPVEIKVGDAEAAFGMGVLAVSAGSEGTVPLEYQYGNVSKLRPSGGSGFGNNVTVDNKSGSLEAAGDSAFGIVALSLGGEASVGLRGIDAPGEYNLPKKEEDRPDVSIPLGTVKVINDTRGSIRTNGAGAHGIIAASLASGGITYLDVDESLLQDHPDVNDPEGDVDGDGVKNSDDNDIDGDGVPNYGGQTEYEGDGARKLFPFSFKTIDHELEVVIEDEETLERFTLSEGVYWNPSFNPDQDASPGGTVILFSNFTLYENQKLIIRGAADPDDDDDGLLDDPCKSEAPGEEPYCAGVQTAYVVGANGGGSPRKGGAVHVYNHGTILTGDPDNIENAYHAMGVFAQSVGGGGGSSTGGFWFFHGDKAGPGGDGGAVSVENSGVITTWGHFSTGILAQSIGGGGGSSGDNTGLFVSVGGKGGAGGNGATVDVTLDASGRIETHGAFAQGVVAQSIGGGGGKGGGATSWGAFVGVAVGGPGGDGGDGAAVAVTGLKDASDAVYSPTADYEIVDPASMAGGFEIWTEGGHGVGILAQSIGGGGGSGGASHSRSVGFLGDVNLAFGGHGGGGGAGSTVTVASALDVYTVGDDAMGIVAQSIGGGGGAGGSAHTATVNIEVSSEGDLVVPNGSFVASFGGGGGDGGKADTVTLKNGGMVWTDGEQAIGILAQSIGGGGGAGGDAKAANRALPIKFGKESYVVALDLTMSVGGSGGGGGDAGNVYVRNASTDANGIVSAGHILARSDNSIGILAQSIGGGGGNGGAGDVSAYTLLLSQLYDAWTKDPFKFAIITDKKIPNLNLRLNLGVGGSGGGGGRGGYVEAFNGEQIRRADGTFAITPGTIQTLGGNSPGMVLQSIGGGGGAGGSSAVSSIGATLVGSLSVGGSGGNGGGGGGVYALNPRGAVISTGTVLTLASSAEDIADGSSPFYRVTTGAGSVGLFAQSIGGGGGSGGSADASSAITSGWTAWAADFFGFVNAFKSLYNGVGKEIENPEFGGLNLNVNVGGSGGGGGSGGNVAVDNGGTITTHGDQAFGIHAQSIGGGGGTGAATESVDTTVAGWIANVEEILGGDFRISMGVSVGGSGGGGGNGGTVTVNQYSGAAIETHGSTAHGILAQSIGGGGGFGGMSANSAEGIFYLGFHWDGKQGPSGYGSTVTVKSGGTIETFGNDSNGILAQSIGNGGGTAAAPCTNTAGISGQSPCWGNNQAVTPDPEDQESWGYKFPLRFSIGLGGGKSDQTDTGEDGGDVAVDVTGDITTHGMRSMGVVAQSIGGGGGYVSADQAGLKLVDIAPSAGYSHSHGRKVTVDVSAAITTSGDGSWGVLAQSIGGSGGFAADSSQDLGALTSNTVPNHCCKTYSTGADGGEVDVTLKSGGTISTTGKNAHGIVAQSVGGGGGFAAHWDDEPDWEGDENDDGILNEDDPAYWDAHRPESLWGGNPTASDWLGQNNDVWWTGQGGEINVSIESGASVDVSGEGSIGILAQSTGNVSYMSTIRVTVAGTVVGGSGFDPAGENDDDLAGPAAITVSGGQSRNNGHDGGSDNPNSIRVTGTGRVYGHVGVDGPDLNAVAIRAIDGYNQVTIDKGGEVWGEVFIGKTNSDTLDAVLYNYGTWYAGPRNLIACNYHNLCGSKNYGLVVIRQPTTIDGGHTTDQHDYLITNMSGGTFEWHDPQPYAKGISTPLLTLTAGSRMGSQLDSHNKLVFNSGVLENQGYHLLRAYPSQISNISATISGEPSLLYSWQVDAIWLSAEYYDHAVKPVLKSTGAALQASLGRNGEAVAQYLQRAWDSNDRYFGKHFAYMLGIQTIEQHREMLSAIDAPELLHHENATLRALPTLLGEVIDCPRTGGAEVIVGEGSCAWMQGGQSWSRYKGNDTPKGDIDADLYSMGVQQEFRPGWYVGGVLGRMSSDIKADGFRGDGHTNMAGLGIKHTAGRWLMGASLAYAKGSYDSLRRFELPDLMGGVRAPAPDAVISSDSEMDVTALRARASYEFGSDAWYLRPSLDVDLLRAERPGFEEDAGAGDHLFRLRADGETRTDYAFVPHVELGTQLGVGEATVLRAYVDAGVRLAPDADREIALQVAGADNANGWFRNTIDEPLATGTLKVGAQLFREDALDLRLEYGLEANGDFRNQSATARLAWHF